MNSRIHIFTAYRHLYRSAPFFCLGFLVAACCAVRGRPAKRAGGLFDHRISAVKLRRRGRVGGVRRSAECLGQTRQNVR